MTGRKFSVPGGRLALRAVAEALPGQQLTVFLALIAVGAIALGTIAFGGGSAAPAAAGAFPVGQQEALSAHQHEAAPATKDGELINPASPEPTPPAPDAATARSIPLSAADKLLLVKVRQANLWEIPTGQQAQQKATNPIVKTVGATLAENHQELDTIVLRLAAELNVTLPNTPNAQQQGWLADLAAKTGPAYDQAFADHLRYAHGLVFNVIAQVRTSTHNPLIRSFAQTANIIVMRHMTLLESTGLVDYNQLPAAVIASAAPATKTSTNVLANQSPGVRTVVIVLMLAAAAFIGTVSIRRVRRGE
jgi:predicted outer membrane protein